MRSQRFASFTSSFLTMMQVATLDSWSGDVVRPLLRAPVRRIRRRRKRRIRIRRGRTRRRRRRGRRRRRRCSRRRGCASPLTSKC